MRAVVSDSLGSYALQPARLLCPCNSPGQNTGVGCHAFLQGIFQTQGSNPHLCLLHWQAGSLLLEPSGMPRKLETIQQNLKELCLVHIKHSINTSYYYFVPSHLVQKPSQKVWCVRNSGTFLFSIINLISSPVSHSLSHSQSFYSLSPPEIMPGI